MLFRSLVTSYNILQRDIKLLGAIEYSTVLLDEAHVIKDRSTRSAKAAAAPAKKAAARKAPVRRG